MSRILRFICKCCGFKSRERGAWLCPECHRKYLFLHDAFGKQPESDRVLFRVMRRLK